MIKSDLPSKLRTERPNTASEYVSWTYPPPTMAMKDCSTHPRAVCGAMPARQPPPRPEGLWWPTETAFAEVQVGNSRLAGVPFTVGGRREPTLVVLDG